MQTSCSGGAESIEEHCLLNIVWRYFRVYLVAISDLTAPAVGPQFNHLCVHLLIPVWISLNSNENISSYPYGPSEVADNKSRSVKSNELATAINRSPLNPSSEFQSCNGPNCISK